MKRILLFVLLALLLACVHRPQVVTVVTPYTPILALDPDVSTFLGEMRCDLAGQPVIYLHPNLPEQRAVYVLHHERWHVAQARAFGSCPAFIRRYTADSAFKLAIEGEAYCSVLLLQRRLGVKADPDYETIVTQLTTHYTHKFEREHVQRTLPCY